MNAMSTTPADSAATHEIPRSTVVANRLRVALAALDLNVSAAARILGWSQSNLQRMTKGHVKLSVDQLDWIQARLGVPMTYLLGLTDDLPGLRKASSSNVHQMPARPAAPEMDPATVVFYDGSGDQTATASGELPVGIEPTTFSLQVKPSGKVLRFRPRTTPKTCPATGRLATVIPFPA